ncbi:ABC-three component system middle component 7 [Desulfovibrio desulfuricans]|uniref:ABC-three component system middle component 7 n=1 Tax=Desulfovibrio desulfuricans TaxID=876 RepID=UPI00398AA2F3
MIVPNKIVRYKNSILPKLSLILVELQHKDIPPIMLYNKLRTKFEDVNQFIIALDVLFAIGKIVFDNKAGVLSYAGANKLQ